MLRRIPTRRRPDARQADGDLASPKRPCQKQRVRRHGNSVLAPRLVETEKRTNAEPAHAGPSGAFGRTEPPVVVALLSGEVKACVRLAVVRLLVDDDAVRACN